MAICGCLHVYTGCFGESIYTNKYTFGCTHWMQHTCCCFYYVAMGTRAVRLFSNLWKMVNHQLFIRLIFHFTCTHNHTYSMTIFIDLFLGIGMKCCKLIWFHCGSPVSRMRLLYIWSKLIKYIVVSREYLSGWCAGLMTEMATFGVETTTHLKIKVHTYWKGYTGHFVLVCKQCRCTVIVPTLVEHLIWQFPILWRLMREPMSFCEPHYHAPMITP